VSAPTVRGDGGSRRVLALGVHLTGQPSRAVEISRELGASRSWRVEQAWVAFGPESPPLALAGVTVWHSRKLRPKFTVLNELLARSLKDDHAHVLFVDDDIGLPSRFVDDYLALVERHDLALAQPARTHGSYLDHHFVEQLDGLDARWTRFVEIGPLFSVRRDALGLLTPFDPLSPMGWGYDFAWPVVMERHGLKMGVVDATPVAHDLRPPVKNYSYAKAVRAMRRFLAATPHLSRAEAFRIIEAHAERRP
jgi:hypothetical protein